MKKIFFVLITCLFTIDVNKTKYITILLFLIFICAGNNPGHSYTVKPVSRTGLSDSAPGVNSDTAYVSGSVLHTGKLKNYVEQFNSDDWEPFRQAFTNDKAGEFLSENIPLFDCPDADFELTYYFRWWTFRKHLKETPEGWVITEFLPSVPWAGNYNTINCGSAHHIREGRWLKDQKYVRDYFRFWLRGNGKIRQYSFWVANSMWEYIKVNGDVNFAIEFLPDLVNNYKNWEKERQDSIGLFWQTADLDGMEAAIGSHGFRPTINSYMYGDALSIAHIADLSGQKDLATEFRQKAASLKKLVQEKLWNPVDDFFEVRESPMSLGLLGWRINGDIEITRKAKPSASIGGNMSDLKALNNGAEPGNSWDKKIPRMEFRGKMGTSEWIRYDFPAKVTFSSIQIYLTDGHIMRPPETFRILYQKSGKWVPVDHMNGTIDAMNRWNNVSFDPVTSNGLKLEFRLSGYNRKVLHFRNVRELLGYTPWCFNLPDSQYSIAWKQITDPEGFAAPYGLTTAEQRHPEFLISYVGHQCQWKGPVWPFATTQTLVAMGNMLNDYDQDIVNRRTYFDALSTYARSHRMVLPCGKIIPWIDENQNPYTGDWIARTFILNWEKTNPSIWQTKGGTSDRGKDYNHSGFTDLVINGLVGLRPQVDNRVVVNPLIPDDTWEWFCLDRVPYHGQILNIIWDRDGTKYQKGKGFSVFVDGELKHNSKLIEKTEIEL